MLMTWYDAKQRSEEAGTTVRRDARTSHIKLHVPVACVNCTVPPNENNDSLLMHHTHRSTRVLFGNS